MNKSGKRGVIEIAIFVVIAIIALRLTQSDAPRVTVVGAGATLAGGAALRERDDIRLKLDWKRHELAAATAARVQAAIRDRPSALIIGFDERELEGSELAWGTFLSVARAAENENLVVAMVLPRSAGHADGSSDAERREALCSGQGFRFCVEGLDADADAAMRQRFVDRVVRDAPAHQRAWRASTQRGE